MKARLGSAVALASLVLVVACASSSSPSGGAGGATPGGATPGGATPGGGSDSTAVTQTVGVAGGSVSAPGIVLDIPAGALAGDTPISITSSASDIPVGYMARSPLYTFSPDGTVFQKAATATFTLSSAGSSPIVYWSNAAGGYDALATTAIADTSVSASIAHFSRGFVAQPYAVGTTSDGGSDSGPSDGGASDGGSPPSDGGPTVGITATLDGITTTFAANAFAALGTGTTTIKGDDNASSTHWTVQMVLTGVMQEECQLNGNPFMTYTHYTNGAVDALYSTKATSGVCGVLLTNNPKQPGDYATGTFTGTVGVVNAPASSSQTHVFGNAAFDVELLAGS